MRKKINYFFFLIFVFIGFFFLTSCGGSSQKSSNSNVNSTILENSSEKEESMTQEKESSKESESKISSIESKSDEQSSKEESKEFIGDIQSSIVESEESKTKEEESSTTTIVEVETTYKVYHYQEKLDTDGYTLKGLEELPGTSSYLTEAEAQSYPGFIVQQFNQEIIMLDGSTEIRIYYNRPRFEVVVEKIGSGTVTGAGVYKEGQTVTCTQSASTGYEFEGWYVCDHLISDDTTYSFLVSEKTTVCCKFKNQIIDYTVNHYQENLNNNEFTLVENDTTTLSGDSFSTTKAQANNYTGFTPKEIEQKEINSDGSTVVNIYYERNKHTVGISNLSPESGSATGAGKFKYGAEVTVNAEANTGYIFDGWYVNNERVATDTKYTFTMGDTNVSLEARFKAQVVNYIVYHYQESLSGTYATAGQPDVLSGDAFSTTNATARTYEGFTAKTIEQKEINPDGTTTVNVYYDRITKTVSITNANPTMGSVTGAGTYKYGLTIIATASPLDAYAFDGWYMNGSLKNSSTSYQITIGLDDISLEARFKYKNVNYTVEHYQENINDSNYTIVSGATQTLSGEPYSMTTASAKSYTGFTVKTLEQQEINPDGSTVVKVYYNRVRYKLTINVNASSRGTVTGAGTYKYQQVATCKGTPYTGYYFLGFNETNSSTITNTNQTRTFTITSNKTIYAYFNINEHDINLNVTGTNKSNVTVSGTTSSYGYYYYGYNYTVNVSISTNDFISIQIGDNDAVLANTLTFTMPNEDIEVIVTVSPMIRTGNKVYYGIYPQSRVDDSTTLKELNKNIGSYPSGYTTNGWIPYEYFDQGVTNSYFMYYMDVTYKNDIYRAVYFTKYRPQRTSDPANTSTSTSYQDDSNYLINTVYWFKYEPISWTIVEEENGQALIVADLVLDSREIYNSSSSSSVNHYYYWTTTSGSNYYGHGYANNYALSSITRWLNAQFASTAFTYNQIDLLNEIELDNSASQSSSSSNSYYCDNFTTSIFLLSYQEFTEYFPDNTGGTTGTEYAICQGFNPSNAYWWLRTSSRYNGYTMDGVRSTGVYNTYVTDYTTGGVRPACWITV